MTVTIQLRAVIDSSQPILQAKPLDGYGKQYTKVEIVSAHPVWRGAVLTRDHFNAVETGRLVG